MSPGGLRGRRRALGGGQMPSIRPGTGAQGQEAKGLANPSESWLVGGRWRKLPPNLPWRMSKKPAPLLPARGALAPASPGSPPHRLHLPALRPRRCVGGTLSPCLSPSFIYSPKSHPNSTTCWHLYNLCWTYRAIRGPVTSGKSLGSKWGDAQKRRMET